MGESIMEGTVVEWSKKPGDSVEQEETLLEIATDKLDSEVPAPVAGILMEILVEEGATVEVGKPIAILETDPEAAEMALQKESPQQKTEDHPIDTGDDRGTSGDMQQATIEPSPKSGNGKAVREKTTAPERHSDAVERSRESVQTEKCEKQQPETPGQTDAVFQSDQISKGDTPPQRKGSDGRFYSPLVRAIAREEGVSQEELESLKGSGHQGRVTKEDILAYVKSVRAGKAVQPGEPVDSESTAQWQKGADVAGIQGDSEKMAAGWPQENVEIVTMDRMRRVISEHMVHSLKTSAHVTAFSEADVTRLVMFREKNKDEFHKKYGFKLTYTPFFMEATIQALRENPLLNSSVDGDRIIVKHDINYGLAVALGASGKDGLLVPVIKKAGDMNIQALAKTANELVKKARNNQLSPDDLAGGTFTYTNYGSVGNLMGTPIINQPEVAIFGTGMIQKRPVVIEVEGSDTIAIRHMVYLSMSYDHRIIDGALGGAFIERVKQLLENFDINRSL